MTNQTGKLSIAVGLVVVLAVLLLGGGALVFKNKNRQKRPPVPPAEDGDEIPPSGKAKLLFRSGFEADTHIAFENGRYILAGKDMTSGYSWENDMPAEQSWFEYLIGKNAPDNYVTTEIQNGVLYQEVKADWSGDGLLTRNAYNIRPPADMKQAYVRYKMKFQDDFLSVWPDSDAWRIVMEWKEPNADQDKKGTSHYRFNLQIRNNPQGVPAWLLEGQVVEPVRKNDWYASENVPVPIGEWFVLEVFWRYGDESTGRVWAKVNGTLVADYTGRTQHPTDPLGLDFWAIFKNYSHVSDWGGPAKQWIDDVEIWSDVPN